MMHFSEKQSGTINIFDSNSLLTDTFSNINLESVAELENGGNIQSTLHAGLNPDSMFNDALVGAVPIPNVVPKSVTNALPKSVVTSNTGSTATKTSVSVGLPHTNTGNQIKSTSVMGTINSGANALGNAVQSGAQSTVNTIQSGVSSIANTVSSGVNRVTSLFGR